jgi:hypothetical protein
MISHLLLVAVFILLVKRFVDLLVLIQRKLRRSGDSGYNGPPRGGSVGATAEKNRTESPSSPLPGVYAVNHDLRRGSQRSELMIAVDPELLPEIFLDLMEKLGEQIVLILGESRPGEKPDQLISFTPLLNARQVQELLAEFADVINHLGAIEVTAQNMEKCCYLTLNRDKSILLEACNATPYISVLQRRGLREVQAHKLDADRPHGHIFPESDVPEERLAQFKQRLEISSSYLPRQTWVN